MKEGFFERDHNAPRWDTVGFLNVDLNPKIQIMISCDGVNHCKKTYNTQSGEYGEPGDVYPCNPAEHSPLFDRKPE